MTGLADRQIEITLRNRVLFGVGALARLPELVATGGWSRAFLVTDPGLIEAGIAGRAVEVLAAAAVPSMMFGDVESNPSGATVEFGSTTLQSFGLEGTVVVALGGGSAMDAAKAIALCSANDRPPWELEYDGPTLVPASPIVAVPTTAGTGSEAHPFAVITRE